jgi:hypothetical protein
VTHLPHLDEVAWRFFGSDRAREAVRKKVELVFPKHEWDRFTDHFFGAFQRWREDDAAARAAEKPGVGGGRDAAATRTRRRR